LFFSEKRKIQTINPEKSPKNSFVKKLFRKFQNLLRIFAKIAAVWFLSTVATVLF